MSANRRWNEYAERTHVAGGTLRVPKTSAERLALVIRLARLKADFLRRQAGR